MKTRMIEKDYDIDSEAEKRLGELSNDEFVKEGGVIKDITHHVSVIVIINVIVNKLKWYDSISEVKRIIKQGGLRYKQLSDPEWTTVQFESIKEDIIFFKNELIIKAGKRNYFKITE